MIHRWRPTGHLDIETDPSALPQQLDGRHVVSGAMVRCLNLRVDRPGQAATRYGSTRFTTQVTGDIHRIVEQGGFRYSFAGTRIYQDESSIATGLTDASWSASKYKTFTEAANNIFATNGTDKKRIQGSTVFEWGIDAPTVAPTLTPTGSGTTYAVTYTYCRFSDGALVSESNPVSPVTTSAGTAILVEWTASSDPQVTHVRVYRSLSGGGTTFLADTVAIGTTQTTLTVSDSVGAAAPDDHDRLPDNVVALSEKASNGYVFAFVGNLLYFCKPQQPDYWPLTFFVECGTPQFPGRAIVEWQGQIYAITSQEIYQIQGTGFDSFYPIELKAKTGCLSELTAEPVAGQGIFHMAQDGVYRWNGASDDRVSDSRFGAIWRGETVEATPGINKSNVSNSWIHSHEDKLYIGYPTDEYPDNVLVARMDDERTVHFQYSIAFRTIATDFENDRLIVGDTDGYLWVIEVATATDDNGVDISWDTECKDFGDQLRKYFPRYAKYDVEITSGTATGRIEMEGVTKQTHALVSRKTRKRLINTCEGDRLSFGVSGTGVSIVRMVEVE